MNDMSMNDIQYLILCASNNWVPVGTRTMALGLWFQKKRELKPYLEGCWQPEPAF